MSQYPNRLPLRPRRSRLAAVAAALAAGAVVGLAGCASPPPPTLYEQLGGRPALERVVDGLVERAAHDPRTARPFVGVRLAYLKRSIVAHLCGIADGPDCQYEGETMANAHADLGITAGQFETMVAALRASLDDAGVPDGAKNELLRRLAPMKRVIVTAGPVR